MPITFQILISTMFRENLDFLTPIFVNNTFEDFDIIVVNQTTEAKIITSELKNVTVINSLERGSPTSRNLAIRTATADVCLMSDDDIVYQSNLKQTVIDAYQENPNADMISFEALNEDGQPYTYYYDVKTHHKKSLKKIYTWVISFKRESFKQHQVYFNHYFGVGSVFKGATEYVFLRTAYDKGLTMIHEQTKIVTHPNISSGVLMGGDNSFFARTALAQRFWGNLSYIWLLKFTLFMWKDGFIKRSEILAKFKIGLNGITTYKKLKSAGEINKIYES